MQIIDGVVKLITKDKAREFDMISDKLINANMEIKRLRKLVQRAALSIDDEVIHDRIMEELDVQDNR